MGWFWASKSSEDGANQVLEPQPRQTEEKLGGVFWATPQEPSQSPTVSGNGHTSPPKSSSWFSGSMWSSCPVNPSNTTTTEGVPTSGTASECPVMHKSSSDSESKCPVDHTKFASSKLNPLNNMPERISDTRAPGQKGSLPTERTMSTIPKGKENGDGYWEYPSPQQMLNAMVRKSGSMQDIPEDAVESMVGVHNFLNEGVWGEVLEWEQPHTEESHIEPRLLRFTGRPNEMSPRARFLQFLGKVYPSKFGFPPPFDRHDWTVLRAVPGQDDKWEQVRYVIDFYEAPDEGDAPAFSVDVRPALDSFGSFTDRFKHTCGPVWDKAMGRST